VSVGIDPITPTTEHADLADLANLVLGVADAHGIRRFHLVGHAFGNRLARMVTALAPTQVASLTLLAAGGLVPFADEIGVALSRCFTEVPGSPAHLEAVRTAFFAEGHDPSIWAGGWDAGVAAFQRSALERTPLERWWGAVAERTLVIQGLDDVLAVPENGRRYVAEQARAATLVEIANAGHALVVEQPAAIAQAMLAFYAAA
jgi:pimeloyl-ACP methyl ester carboxylesterase